MIAELLAFAAAAAGTAAVVEMSAGVRTARRGPVGALALTGRVLVPRTLAGLADLERRLVEAGRPGGMTARDLLAAKAAGAVTAVGCGLVAGAILPGRLGLAAAFAAPAAGFFAPDLWLARRRADRFAQMRRDLPALLDLLRVAVEAGLSLPEALAQVGRRSRAPLARLWGGVAAQVAVGVPLTSALDDHARELPIEEVHSTVAALRRATRHGAPLSDTLEAQARAARLARRHAVQEAAARAGPKMQLVIALLLVPSVMLLVAAALLNALGGSGPQVLGVSSV